MIAPTKIAPTKPQWLTVKPQFIPKDLRVADQWVLWRAEWRENANGEWKWTKPPYQTSGRYAKSTSSTTWSPLRDVLMAYLAGSYDGIGRVFSADDPYVVIDLDHCRNPDTGIVEQWAVDLIQLLSTFTEISPSGTGIRMVVRAKLPEGSRNRKGNVEIYDNARYCTFTGHLLPGAIATVEARQEEVEEFLRRVFPPAAKPEIHNGNGNGRGGAAPNLDDAALLERARRSRNGEKFTQLLDRGDWQAAGYASQSEADLALCSMLAFWLAGDAAAIDRAFRSSALYREKWNRADYREPTITAALSGRGEFYDPNRRQANENGSKAEAPDGTDSQSEQSSSDSLQQSASDLGLISAATVKMKPVRWTWPGYFPAGKLCDIEGNPGDGKSVLLADLAARVTCGLPWPDGTSGGEPGDVLLFSAEDDATDTIIPRLAAAGADLARVHIIGESSPAFPEDCDQLEQTIQKYNAKLVAFDPIDPFLNPRIDGNKNIDVRRALSQLRAVAEATACAILMIRHLSKDGKVTNAIYRGLGSIAYTAAARATFLVGRKPDDPNTRVLCGIKCNLSKMPPALSFQIVEEIVSGEDSEPVKTQKIEWLGPVEVSSRELLTEPEPTRRGPQPKKREAAEALIKEFLADGLEHSSDELKEKATAAGISHGTLWQARKDLGVRSRKRGFSDDWLISLQTDDEGE